MHGRTFICSERNDGVRLSLSPSRVTREKKRKKEMATRNTGDGKDFERPFLSHSFFCVTQGFALRSARRRTTNL